MEKKSSRHGETIKSKQKHQNQPNNQPDEDKNKEHDTNVMSQGTIRERKKNVNNNKQVLTFHFFN